jgi:hypothetical protein
MASVIPGILRVAEIGDVLSLVAPRPFLVISAEGDAYSADADRVCATAAKTWAQLGRPQGLLHERFSGDHAVTMERFEYIVEWAAGSAAGSRT